MQCIEGLLRNLRCAALEEATKTEQAVDRMAARGYQGDKGGVAIATSTTGATEVG